MLPAGGAKPTQSTLLLTTEEESAFQVFVTQSVREHCCAVYFIILQSLLR